MKDTRLAYVAGLIDADGSLYISRAVRPDGYIAYDPTLMIRTTHTKTAKWLVQIFGGTFDCTHWQNGQWKDYHRWKFSSDVHASRFLDLIDPYLWLKKKQAAILHKFYAMRGLNCPSLRENFWHEISHLNQNFSVTTNTSRLPLQSNLRQAYLAGMFDGEGSFYIIRVRQSEASRGKGFYYRACISLGSTCCAVVNELKALYGGFVRERPPHNGILPMYEWDIKDNKRKELFLLAVLPYLITKREQAKIVLNFVRLNGQPNPRFRESMWKQCSNLNGKQERV